MTGPLPPRNSQAGLASIRAGIPSARLAASRKHDREVAAKALRDAVTASHATTDGPFWRAWIIDRANRIEAGDVDL